MRDTLALLGGAVPADIWTGLLAIDGFVREVRTKSSELASIRAKLADLGE